MLIGELDAGAFITEENGFWISLLLLVFIIITSLILLPFLVNFVLKKIMHFFRLLQQLVKLQNFVVKLNER